MLMYTYNTDDKRCATHQMGKDSAHYKY